MPSPTSTVADVVAVAYERDAKIADAAGVSVRGARWAWSQPQAAHRPARRGASGPSAAPRRAEAPPEGHRHRGNHHPGEPSSMQPGVGAVTMVTAQAGSFG